MHEFVSVVLSDVVSLGCAGATETAPMPRGYLLHYVYLHIANETYSSYKMSVSVCNGL